MTAVKDSCLVAQRSPELQGTELTSWSGPKEGGSPWSRFQTLHAGKLSYPWLSGVGLKKAHKRLMLEPSVRNKIRYVYQPNQLNTQGQGMGEPFLSGHGSEQV